MKGIDAACVSDYYSKQKRRSNAILEDFWKEYPQLSTVAYLQIPAAHLHGVWRIRKFWYKCSKARQVWNVLMITVGLITVTCGVSL